MPEATLRVLSGLRECRSDKAFTPHPTIGAPCRRRRCASCPAYGDSGRIRRLRRIRQSAHHAGGDAYASCPAYGDSGRIRRLRRIRHSAHHAGGDAYASCPAYGNVDRIRRLRRIRHSAHPCRRRRCASCPAYESVGRIRSLRRIRQSVREQEEIYVGRVRRSRSPAKRINNNYTRDPTREMSGRSPK